MAPWIPTEPTSEQCNANERVPNPDGDAPAYAVWWPQMGGYSGRAVITAGDCPEVWVWHDGAFPFSDEGKPGRTGTPARLHLCDSDQWIELFEKQKCWAAEWRGDAEDPEPYVWRLPQGVTYEQAKEVYEKGLAWGLWEPDPGGFVIVTWENQRHVCEPIPCPPFEDFDLDEYSPQAHPTAADLVRAGVDLTRFAKSADWEPEDPLLVKLHDARLAVRDALAPSTALHEAVESMLRSTPEKRAATPLPLIVTIPQDVAPDQAMEWIQGCQRLGLIETHESGVLLIPPGAGL